MWTLKSLKLRSRVAWHGLRSLSLSVYVGAGLLFLLVSIAAMGGVNAARHKVIDALSPVITLADTVQAKSGQFAVDVAAWSGLRAENEALRNEIHTLQEWQQTALMLQAENDSLRDLLNVQESDAGPKFITARVIADTSSSYAKSLIINAGLKAGVREGQCVIAADGLIGRVLEQGQDTARVLLLEDINSRVPVLVEGSNERAVLAGQNENAPVLEHLRSEHQVKEGERVITSGLGGVFPYGLAVGTVHLAKTGKVEVKLLATPEKSRHVQVVDYALPGLTETRNYADAQSTEQTPNAAR